MSPATMLDRCLRPFGFKLDVTRSILINPDLHERSVEQALRFSMISRESMETLVNAISYCEQNNVEGVMIDCGTWKGGCALAMLSCTLNRKVEIFDTFKGTVNASDKDVDGRGRRCRDGECAVKRGDVEHALTDYYWRWKIHEADVEKTLITWEKKPIALARIDTNTYASTKVELETFWPLISTGGFLIVDDYGHYSGVRRAVDDFLMGFPLKEAEPFINWVDKSCILMQKRA